MGDTRALDASFLRVIQEIEKSYKELSRPIRIRVEKWLEKLVSTGSNVMWKKQRNMYATLLLDMVAKKRLTEPFNLLPPDGSLPQFPAYVRTSHTRDLLGPHETSFWRELYNQMQNIAEVTRASDAGVRLSPNNPAIIPGSDTYRFHHEINNLRLLIKEQSTRIKLLEQHLHDERMKHELEIQRMIISHRIELGKAIKQSEVLDRLKYSPPTSPLRDGPSVVDGAKLSRSPELLSSSINRRTYRYNSQSSSINASGRSLAASFPVFNEHERNNGSEEAQQAVGRASSWMAATTASQQPEQGWETSGYQQDGHGFVRQTADIIPTRGRSSAASSSDISQMRPNDSNHQPSSHHNNNQQQEETSDEEFLSYVDRFQGEIHKVVVDDEVDGDVVNVYDSRQSADSLQFN